MKNKGFNHQNMPPRVAPRLEGVVKNRGIKPGKKPKQSEVKPMSKREIKVMVKRKES